MRHYLQNILHTEIYTHFHKRKRSFQHLGFLYLGNVFAAVSGLFIVIALANLLTQNEYGTYKYIYSLAGILSVLSFSGGFRTIALQAAVKGYDGIILILARKNAWLNVPMLVGACALGSYYYFHGNVLLGASICIVTIAMIIGNTGIIGSAYLNGRREYKKLFITQSVVSFTNMLALISAAFFFENLLYIISIAATTSSIISLGIFFYIRSHLIRNTETNDRILTYGKHLGILNIVSTVMQHIDSVLIFKFLGSQNLALYAIATPFIDRILGFFKISYFFVLPKFTEYGPIEARKLLYRRSVFAGFIGIITFIGYVVVSPLFFSIFFPTYEESVKISWLFALNIPLVAFSILPQAYLDALIEAKNKYIVNGVIFGTRMTTLLLFIHPFGITGVIWSELITRLLGLALIIILIERYQRKDKLQTKESGTV